VIGAVALLGYAALLLTVPAPALARARWPDRAPRLAVAAWFALTGSALASVILAGLAPVMPGLPVSGNLARLLAACLTALRGPQAGPGGAAAAVAGAVLALAVIARVAWCTAGTLAGASLARRRHRRRLRLAGRADVFPGALVVAHGEPAAYCLAGRRQPVVLTSAALAALDDAQLAAVLAHERAHQRGRHHLLVALAGSLAAAFPRIPALRRGHEQVARLVELLADDAAAAASHRLDVAAALLALAAPVPVAVLGAGGPATAARVRRLIAAPAPLGRAAAAAAVVALAALAAVPLAVAAGPAWPAGCPDGRALPAAAAPSTTSPVPGLPTLDGAAR
jgi:Zn-dependent protease with chaperone function